MIVVDANVVVYCVVESELTALARRVAQRDAQWVVPPLWRYEVTSALTTLTRGKAISFDQALTAVAAADRLTEDREMPVGQELVLETAIRFDLSAYDAQYVALAVSAGVPCVTADRKVIARAPEIAVSMREFLADA